MNLSEAESERVLDDLHGQFLLRLRWLCGISGPLFVLISGPIDWMSGTFRPLLVAEYLLIGALFASTFPRSRTLRRVLTSACLLALAVAALVNFGASAGSGVVWALTALIVTFFFGSRGFALVALVQAAAWVAFALAVNAGLLEFEPRSAVEWVRQGLSVAGGMLGIALVFLTLQGSFLRAIAAEAQARVRQQEAEDQRRRAVEAHARGQRLQSLGRLAGGVAHDFNNALMGARIGIELLAAKIDGNDATLELVDDLHAAIDRAAASTALLMGFAKGGQVGHSGQCQVRDVVPRLVRSLRAAIPEHVRIRSDLDDSDAEARIPGSALEQVLLNIVLNACDAMPDGGEVHVTVRHDGDQDVIAVRDTGVGMTSEVLAQAFEPFFTTKGEVGTGMGLSMVWGTVSQIGGTVEAESQLGEGTTITLRLPTGDAAVVEGLSGDLTDRLDSVRVLVIEDNPVVLRGLEKVLVGRGAEVRTASRATTAQSLLDGGLEIDLLMTDTVVPGGGTLELVDRFRSANPNAPVILCSGHVDRDLPEGLATDPRFRFARKPIGPDALVRMMRELLDAAA